MVYQVLIVFFFNKREYLPAAH